MKTPSIDPKLGYMDGYEVRVKNRRRYGDVTFTWMEGRIDGTEDWVTLGDPWQYITPKRCQVHATALLVLFNVPIEDFRKAYFWGSKLLKNEPQPTLSITE